MLLHAEAELPRENPRYLVDAEFSCAGPNFLLFDSRGRYADKVLPLLAFAQEKLVEKAEKNGGISNTQPDIVLSSDTGKPQDLRINLSADGNVSFDPGVHIDPRGHDVYTEDNNAQRLFCVPVDRTSTLQLLKESVELKHCAARALQHSRELSLRYLAGLGKSGSRLSPNYIYTGQLYFKLLSFEVQ